MAVASVDIMLASGRRIVSGWIDDDDPERLPAGDYLQVIDQEGREVFYAEVADMDSRNLRQVLCEFLQAAVEQ